MILILSDEADGHYKYVREKLEARGAEILVLDTSQFPSGVSIGFKLFKSDYEITFEIGTRKVRGEEISSVWNRRRPPTALPKAIKTEVVREYIARESQVFLGSLHHILDSFWVSPPDATDVASRKSHQLLLAQRIGLQVPRTFMGNSSAAAKDFLGPLEDIAIKTIGMPAIEIKSEIHPELDCLRLYTRRLTHLEFENFLPQVRNCPVILQPYVQKDFELRITVVGTLVFPCAIYSQATERTREDWRRYDLENTPHKVYALPKDMEEKCVALVKELGLVFGCIDMIVTPDGEHVFLEINPNGQWLWIERLTGMPIGDKLAEMLIAGKVI